MYAWLHGPGAVFRDPLPGSSNYLNAYDKAGRLLRAPKKSDKPAGTGQPGREEDKNSRSEEEQQETREEGRNAAGMLNTKGETPLPPESLEDLRPFPLNRDFRSEAVLSEELRNEIFRRVTEEGQNVRVVSASLNVTMERVAAVVRLKTIEQDWVKQVCMLSFVRVTFTVAVRKGSSYDETQKYNRLVLKTTTWLHHPFAL